MNVVQSGFTERLCSTAGFCQRYIVIADISVASKDRTDWKLGSSAHYSSTCLAQKPVGYQWIGMTVWLSFRYSITVKKKYGFSQHSE